MGVLDERERREIRKKLRELSGDSREGTLARIGNAVVHPANGGDPIRFRFGVSMIGIGLFCAIIANLMPDEEWRLMFLGFGLVTLFVASWQIDKAKKNPAH